MENKKKELERCRTCYGTGRVSKLRSFGAFNSWVYENCGKCKGKGKIEKKIVQ